MPADNPARPAPEGVDPLIARARKAAQAIYVATEPEVAGDISEILTMLCNRLAAVPSDCAERWELVSGAVRAALASVLRAAVISAKPGTVLELAGLLGLDVSATEFDMADALLASAPAPESVAPPGGEAVPGWQSRSAPSVDALAKYLCWKVHPRGTRDEIKRACDDCLAMARGACDTVLRAHVGTEREAEAIAVLRDWFFDGNDILLEHDEPEEGFSHARTRTERRNGRDIEVLTVMRDETVVDALLTQSAASRSPSPVAHAGTGTEDISDTERLDAIAKVVTATSSGVSIHDATEDWSVVVEHDDDVCGRGASLRDALDQMVREDRAARLVLDEHLRKRTAAQSRPSTEGGK